MKSLPLFLLPALCAILCSCESKDSQWHRALIGTWHDKYSTPDGLSVDGKTTYSADGKMQSAGTLTYHNQTLAFSGSGTWKVEDGCLKWTALASSIPKLIPVGYTASDKIVSVTDTQYTYIDSDTGKTEVEYRVK